MLRIILSPFSDIMLFLMYNVAVNRLMNCGFVDAVLEMAKFKPAINGHSVHLHYYT